MLEAIGLYRGPKIAHPEYLTCQNVVHVRATGSSMNFWHYLINLFCLDIVDIENVSENKFASKYQESAWADDKMLTSGTLREIYKREVMMRKKWCVQCITAI